MKQADPAHEIKIDESKHLLPYDYYSTVVENGRPDVLFHCCLLYTSDAADEYTEV